jgi:hypothetical protein
MTTIDIEYTRSGQKYKLEQRTVDFVAIVKRVDNDGTRIGEDMIVPLLTRPTVIDDMGIGWVVREMADRRMIPGHVRRIEVRQHDRVVARVLIGEEA